MRYLLMAGCLTLTGCSTIMNGRRQSVSFNSNPPGAMVRASTGDSCTTPCVMEMRRSKSASFNVEKDGYEPYTAIVKRSASFWILGNIWFWPGFLVDLATKSYYDLDPDEFNFALIAKK